MGSPGDFGSADRPSWTGCLASVPLECHAETLVADAPIPVDLHSSRDQLQLPRALPPLPAGSRPGSPPLSMPSALQGPPARLHCDTSHGSSSSGSADALAQQGGSDGGPSDELDWQRLMSDWALPHTALPASTAAVPPLEVLLAESDAPPPSCSQPPSWGTEGGLAPHSRAAPFSSTPSAVVDPAALPIAPGMSWPASTAPAAAADGSLPPNSPSESPAASLLHCQASLGVRSYRAAAHRARASASDLSMRQHSGHGAGLLGQQPKPPAPATQPDGASEPCMPPRPEATAAPPNTASPTEASGTATRQGQRRSCRRAAAAKAKAEKDPPRQKQLRLSPTKGACKRGRPRLYDTLTPVLDAGAGPLTSGTILQKEHISELIQSDASAGWLDQVTQCRALSWHHL